MGKFNEATRVQMSAMVHLTRLGYKYWGRIYENEAGTGYDSDTNILFSVKMIMSLLRIFPMRH